MKYSELVAELEKQDALKPSDIFNEDNTYWDVDEDGEHYLVYDGEFDELAKEYDLTEDTVFAMFCQYADDSQALLDFVEEREEARKGDY